MSKSKRLITVTAGRLVYAVCYTQAKSTDSEKVRTAKNRCSSAARQKMNFKTLYINVQLQMCANFDRHDLWVTIGFDDEHLPPNRRESKKAMQKFMDRMRTARKGQGEELKYMYAVHELQDDGSRRLHFHMVINSTATRQDFELIRSLWTFGDNIEICELGQSEMYHGDDFLELAQYLVRERNPEAPFTAVGDRGFVGSRNLAKPVRQSEMVDDSLTVCAPPGAYIIDTDSRSNEYGQYAWINYLLPEAPRAERPPRRPRRKKE